LKSKSPITIDRGNLSGVRRRSGFTLTEVMVVLVILAIATGLVALTFRAAIDSRNVALARIDVMEKGRSSLDLMGREFQSAFINELGYLTNSFDFRGYFMPAPDPFFCEEIRVDAGTGGYYVPPGFDWFVMTETIPREIPGNAVDDDGDGLIDEIQMRFSGKPGTRVNGIDDDGDGLTDEDGALPEVGIDDDGDGLTDEDGIYPADMVNFAISRSREEERVYDIAEVGYTIGVPLPEGDQSTRILRRFEALRRDDDLSAPLDGQFIIYDPYPHDGNETEFTIFYAESDPDHNVDILSFDTVGLRFTYWYFNYAVAQELEPYGGDCARIGMSGVRPTDIDNDADGQSGEDPIDGLDNDGDGRIDEDPIPDPSFDPGICDGPWQKVRFWESSLERFPNEEEDVNYDEVTVAPGDACSPARIKAIEHMDGLPNLIEIEIWVFDQERRERSPRYLTSRVQIPGCRPE
jgi:prepilin-type N-terminal cleavage/methylation domain-containing protein